MDERVLFDRFHAALDVEPRPGAFDRLRAAMNDNPAVAHRRPAFRMRFTKMGLRITAAVAVAAIVIALVVALVAGRHGPVSSVPAGADEKAVAAYRSMIQHDYKVMDASTSQHCDTIADTGCADAIARVLPTLAKWVSDMQAFQTPARYKTVDALLRDHLVQVENDLNAAIRFQKAGDSAGFALAMNAALYERAYIDPATFAIEGQYSNTVGSYHDALAVVMKNTLNCVGGTPGPADLACQHLTSASCSLSAIASCQNDVQNASTQIEGYVLAFVQFQPPASVAREVAQLQADFVQADTGLLGVTQALLNRSSDGIVSSTSAYTSAIGSIESDMTAANG